MSTKVAIVALVVVAVLFVVLIGAGAARDDSGADPEGRGWVELFRFGGAPGVDAGDVASGCFDSVSATFVFNGGCSATIGESGDRTRLLSLVAAQGTRVEVDLDPVDDDGIELDDVDVRATESLEAAVGSSGAELSMSCLSSGPCRVVLDG